MFRLKDKFTIIQPSDVVLVEGILVFYDKDMMEMFDMKLFVDTDADTRLARRGSSKFLLVLSEIKRINKEIYMKYFRSINNFLCLYLVLRDIQERGRDLAGVLQQYTKFVKPAFEEFCLPVSSKLK